MLDHEVLGRVFGRAAAVSPYGLAVVDVRARVRWANAAMARLLGLSLDELDGQDLEPLLLPAARADEQAPTDDAGLRQRRRVVRADGSEVVLDVVRTPIPEDIAPGGMVVVQVLPDLDSTASAPDSDGGLPRTPSRVPLRVVQARAVEDAASALAGAVSLADVTAVMERQVEAFEAAGLLVALVEGPRLRLISCRGYPDEVQALLQDQTLHEPSPMAEVVRRRSAIFLETLEEYTSAFPSRAALARASGKQAWAFLPMIAGGQVIGSWCLSYSGPHRFTVSERALLLTLSGLLAQAVARSELLAAELSVSRTLQRSMLPRSIPEVPGCEIAVRYQAAMAGLEVGGDFYDVIPLPKGGTGIVIGDAQGHSAAAAALMGQVRGALRAYAAEGHDPATIVARANRFLYTAGADSFVTCTYAALDALHDGVSIVRAGHPHPLLVTPDGAAGPLEVPGGLPLGIDPQAAYPVTWVPLTTGCRVVLYTDGLVEHRVGDPGEGERHLVERVLAAADRPLEEFADAVVGGEQGREDDVAVLVLERVAASGDSGLRQETFSAAATDATAVRRIRREVASTCRDWGWAARTEEVELLVSELVTNAVLHVGGMVTVTLTATSDRLTVSVSDTSVQSPSLRAEDVWRTSGRGLAIVSAIADEWGVDPSGPGKSVWFSLQDQSA